MTARRPFPVPLYLLLLDGAGALLLVLGVLTATGVDLGLPALAAVWPLLIVLGAALMVPMIVWTVRRGLAERNRG